jgi:hypothetical protein
MRVGAALTHFGLNITPRKDYLLNQHDSKIWLIVLRGKQAAKQ